MSSGSYFSDIDVLGPRQKLSYTESLSLSPEDSMLCLESCFFELIEFVISIKTIEKQFG